MMKANKPETSLSVDWIVYSLQEDAMLFSYSQLS